MEETFRRYPIGIQDFEQLRNNNYIYVDKTALVYQLANTNTVYFLSRPRRFGKSLLVSTLEAYFLGKKELFNGLAMEQLEQDWTVYPVLHIDFSGSKYMEAESLRASINVQLLLWENVYGRQEGEDTFSLRLEGIIRRAYEQTGQQVVVLVDEYDAPMLDTNSDHELQREIRGIMRDFFSPLKKSGKYLRFLFLTGISKFSQMSIFSELNNLQNVSMSDNYAAICGITEQELLTQMKIDIEQMAQANDETYEEACAHLKKQYDGYHFSKSCVDVYNPFSLINAFAQKSYENYWFSTGTPTFLIELLQQMDFDIRLLDRMDAKPEDFDKATDCLTDPIPVLYQSGYLTIKSYDAFFRTYTLGYPNEEVRIGFIESLIPSYLYQPTRESNFYVVSFVRDLMKEWNAIGHVPFKEKDRLYKQYHGIIDQLFDRFNISASNKKLSNFRSNISNIQDNNGSQSLYREREKLMRAYENMKNELQTYENNLGFLTSTSKKGSSLLTELNRKVDKLKADLELVLQKIKVIDESIKTEE